MAPAKTTAVVLAVLVAAACGPVSASPSPVAGYPSPSAPASASARPTATPIALPSFAQINAPSTTVAWMLVAGSRLFRSTDRGSTWDEHSLPSPARGLVVAFVSEREGWATLVESSEVLCQSPPAPIWQTADAAATWQPASTTAITGAMCGGSLSFTDAQHGFIGALDEKSGPLIYHTANGGKTWIASAPISDPPDIPMQGGRADLQFGRVRGFGSTLLVAATLNTSTGPSTHVYRSQDGGAKWTHAASIPSAGALAIVSATRWLRIGPAAVSFESLDAGASWHAYTTDYSQAAPIAPDIVFGDDSTGYAVVRGALQRTLDGGSHWITLKTPGTE